MNGFAQIPNAIICGGSTISLQARGIYAILKRYAWQSEVCWPGQERIAADAGLSSRSVRTYLNELVDCGLIAKQRRGLGQTNVYTLVDAELEQQVAAAPDRKDTSGQDRQLAAEPERKARADQDRQPVADKQDTVETKTQKIKTQQPATNVVVDAGLVQALTETGIATGEACRLVERYDKPYLAAKLTMFTQMRGTAAYPRNPGGWLRAAILNDYTPPPPAPLAYVPNAAQTIENSYVELVDKNEDMPEPEATPCDELSQQLHCGLQAIYSPLVYRAAWTGAVLLPPEYGVATIVVQKAWVPAAYECDEQTRLCCLLRPIIGAVREVRLRVREAEYAYTQIRN